MDLNIKMGIDRDFDSLKDKEVYYLFDRVLNVCLGIFTNEKELCAGVDYWSKNILLGQFVMRYGKLIVLQSHYNGSGRI